MNKKAWIYQKKADVAKVGEHSASWHVGWLDPSGKRKSKSCGPGPKGKQVAERLADKRHAELVTGTYDATEARSWQQFRADFDSLVISHLAKDTAITYRIALNFFESIIGPVKVSSITTETIDRFSGKRLAKGVSPATVNRDLRGIRKALTKAVEWGLLKAMPKIHFLRVMERIPCWVPPEHFAAIYKACGVAKMPRKCTDQAAWWRGLLLFCYVTGWRIGAIVKLTRADIDFAAATVTSRAEHNKGKRDQRIAADPVLLAHLSDVLRSHAATAIFPWSAGDSRLLGEFESIQKAAGVGPVEKRRYGFHDLRRSFATLNVDRVTPAVLQLLMQHKDFQTTLKYISLAHKLQPGALSLYIPPVADVAYMRPPKSASGE